MYQVKFYSNYLGKITNLKKEQILKRIFVYRTQRR